MATAASTLTARCSSKPRAAMPASVASTSAPTGPPSTQGCGWRLSTSFSCAASASSVSGQPSHGVAVAHSDQSITYAPAAGWSGTDTFSYRVDDPYGGSGTATVTVTTVNAPPVANDDMVNTPTNTPVNVDVLRND